MNEDRAEYIHELQSYISICRPNEEQSGFIALTMWVKPGTKLQRCNATFWLYDLTSLLCFFVPVQAAAMIGSGEKELWLAQGKALRDPRPDVPHFLGTYDLWGERVRIKRQLYVTSSGRHEGEKQIKQSEIIMLLISGARLLKKNEYKTGAKV